MKILIGTPVAGAEVTTHYARSLFNLLGHVLTRRPEVSILTPQFFSGALLANARNAYVSLVLQDPTITHLAFIDSDMAFAPDAILRMLDFGQDVLGCLYPMRRKTEGEAQEFVGSASLIRGAQGYVVERGFVRTDQLPTGLMLLRRTALERLRDAYPELLAPADEGYRGYGLSGEVLQCFQQLQGETGLFLSEDFSFCRRWAGLGGEMWALIDEPTAHIGVTPFAGSYFDQLRAGPPA